MNCDKKITEQHIKDLLGLARKCNDLDDRLGVDHIEIGRDLWHMEDTLLGIVAELERVQKQCIKPEPDPAIFLEENGISGDAKVDHKDGAVYAADIMEVYANQILLDMIDALIEAKKVTSHMRKYSDQFESNEIIDWQQAKIDNALKKAGVEFG